MSSYYPCGTGFSREGGGPDKNDVEGAGLFANEFAPTEDHRPTPAVLTLPLYWRQRKSIAAILACRPGKPRHSPRIKALHKLARRLLSLMYVIQVSR
jgi:hypothetical protein